MSPVHWYRCLISVCLISILFMWVSIFAFDITWMSSHFVSPFWAVLLNLIVILYKFLPSLFGENAARYQSCFMTLSWLLNCILQIILKEYGGDNGDSTFELVKCKLTLFYSYWQMNEVLFDLITAGPVLFNCHFLFFLQLILGLSSLWY